MHCRLLHVALFCMVSVCLNYPALAETWTWNGGSPATDAWSDWTNWVGDSSAPFSSPGTDLIFGDSLRSYSSNNLGLFQLRDLTFVGSSSPVLFGDRLEIFRSVINSSSAERALYNPITFGADIAYRAASNNLFFFGATYNAGYTLTTEGSKSIFLLSLSGSGGLDVHGPGQTGLWGSNAYTGATRVYGGSLLALGTDSLRNSTSLWVQGSSTAQIHSATGFFAADTAGRHATVNGANALLHAQDMMMAGTSNSLLLSDGGRATTFGFHQQGQANSVLVQGSGSRLTVEQEYWFGGSGPDNRLWITDGGELHLDSALIITSSFSHVLVRDSGSIITGQAVVVSVSGTLGTGNLLEVRDGGVMNLWSGVFLDGISNTVRVQGAGALIQSPVLGMGYYGAAHGLHLDVSDGGRVDVMEMGSINVSNTLITVRGEGTVIGPSSGVGRLLVLAGVDGRIEISDGARVALSPVLAGTRGTLSVWGSGSSLGGTEMSYLWGTDNSISVSNGAQFGSRIFMIAGDRNEIEVTGAGTIWSNSAEIVFDSANQSHLRVMDGAELTAESLNIEGATDSHFLFSGADTRVTLGGVTATVFGAGSMVVGNGAQVSSGAVQYYATDGALDIVGAGSAWQVDGDLRVATTMRVADGATLSSSSAMAVGNVEITGVGTVWSNRGDLAIVNSASQLHVSDGARVHSRGDFSLNYQTDAIVEGPGSELHIGGNTVSAGRLSVLDGGAVVSSGDILMLPGAAAIFLVSGTGSQLDVGGEIVIYNNTFSILNGGSASADRVTLGNDGTLSLDGGALTVHTLSNTSEPSAGTVEFNAGTLNVSHTEHQSPTSFNVGDGVQTATLNLMGNSTNRHLFAGGLHVREHSELTGEGTIYGDVQIEGVLDIGQSAGYMEVNGLLVLYPTAEVHVDIYGNHESEYDRLRAASIIYGGVLHANFLGFTPTDGSRFQIFDADSFSGSFSETNIVGVYSAGFDAATGEVFVIAAIPEAGTLVLLLGGLAFLSWRRRRRTSSGV
jgi:fibronectin-binding autotransporter adhesin